MEKDIQSKIIKFLKSQGAYVIKSIIANRSGVPDIIACYKGYFCGFEVKNEIAKPTPLQSYNIDSIIQAGGKALVVRSVEDVSNVLDAINKCEFEY